MHRESARRGKLAGARRSIRPRHAVAAVSIAVIGLLIIYYIELTTVQRDYFLERRGVLAEARIQPYETANSGRVLQDVTLVSSTGLTVDMRLLRPVDSGGRSIPTILLINGKRTGKYAVDLLDRPGDVAFAAIDYPYHGPDRVKGLWRTAVAIPTIQQAVLDTPPALMLAVDWLVDQPWTDREKIELAGVSLGVPFAAAAGAIDDRISRLWLVHGGANNQRWAELHLRSKIANDLARRLVTKLTLLLIYAESFDTLTWMQHTAPRPIVIVSAHNDETVPQDFQLADAADAAIAEIIWTEGPHIRASREEQLQKLFDIFQVRIEE